MDSQFTNIGGTHFHIAAERLVNFSSIPIHIESGHTELSAAISLVVSRELQLRLKRRQQN